ncbi:MAG: hypothetical protein GEU97_05130 [Actinophytocola sp.]|nr:hypothetical protein [Actinophytocola sp.]
MRDLITTVVTRVATAAFAIAAGLVSMSGAAFAGTGQLIAAPSATSFGLLGPVGVGAVGIGVVGMIAGAARRRRQALAHAVVARRDVAEGAAAARAERVAESRGSASVPAPSRAPSRESTERAGQSAVESSRAA